MCNRLSRYTIGSMEAVQGRIVGGLDRLFRTGYPHPMNLFAALMLAFLPALSWLSGEAADRPVWARLAGVLLGFTYLAVWSRICPAAPAWRRRARHELYLLAQAVLVAAIYALDGGLTRFLFAVVAVQAVYLIPVRRWAPFVGTLAALWLALYLAITPPEPGANMVVTIGMYLLYLVFAALVTLTMLQQEREGRLAGQLLDGVNQRHQVLREYDQTVEHRAESEERERLARTIHARLVARLSALDARLQEIAATGRPAREAVRAARLEAKDVLGEVRAAVRALRPGVEGAGLDETDAPGRFAGPPEPSMVLKLTDPIRVYHIWNTGVLVVTAGVMLAAHLVDQDPHWWRVLALTLLLLGAYAGASVRPVPYAWRALFVVVQAVLIVLLVWTTREPLMNQLFLAVSAQMVFLMPGGSRGVVAAVAFPTLLTGASLLLFGGGGAVSPLSLTVAFGVTYFFAAVMAEMTRLQLEARTRAIQYAQQLREVNRRLEARLAEARRVAIARERVRMAREIHDGLGHHLTTVIVDLQNAEALADEEPAAALAHVRGALEVIRAAMRSSQEMVETLDRFDRPLPKAIQELVARWMQTTGTPVIFRVDGGGSDLSTAARMTVYRTVQESLTNIQKHARPTRVEITLTQTPDRVTLRVVNDDLGRADHEEPVRSGFGLVGLRERAQALSGEFEAGPRNEGGFQVSLSLPIGL